MLVEALDFEDSLALRSLLRLLNQWNQPGLLMATQSTAPSMKIGTMMSPQSGTKEEMLELMTAGISNMLDDNTVLADAVRYAGVGMWYPSAVKEA